MQPQIRKILLTTDCSDESWRALSGAVTVAKAYGATIDVLHLVDESLFANGALYAGGAYSSPALIEYFEHSRQAAEESIAQRLDDLPVKSHALIRQAPYPPHAIVDTAEEVHADLVMMATHGRTGWRRYLLGSTAESVLRKCKVPVLTVHTNEEGEAAQPALEKPPRKIMLTTDLSDASWHALPWATSLAQRFHAELLVCTVVEEPYYLSYIEGAHSILEVLQEAVPSARRRIEEKLAGAVVPVHIAVVQAPHPVTAIVEKAEEENVDLVVLATHGRTGLPHMMIGSTAERLVRTSSIPVLTVR